MKYTCEIKINKPLDKVIELFDNPDNMLKWMLDLQSFEHISGDPGQAGAKSKLRFKTGKREFEMTETVTVRNLPEEFSGTYEAPGGTNTVRNRFIAVNGKTTKWVSENEFHMTSFMMKLMAFFMPGAFKKQSMKYLQAFKEFAETEEPGASMEANA